MPKYTVMDIKCSRAKYGQMHAAVITMTADNHVPQFSEGQHEDNCLQIIAEIHILLFLRKGTRIGAPSRGTPLGITIVLFNLLQQNISIELHII